MNAWARMRFTGPSTDEPVDDAPSNHEPASGSCEVPDEIPPPAIGITTIHRREIALGNFRGGRIDSIFGFGLKGLVGGEDSRENGKSLHFALGLENRVAIG